LKEQEASRPSPGAALKLTLTGGVKDIQADAIRKKPMIRELGVFFFYSTVEGDAWVMEMTDCDCVQLAKDGVAMEVPIDENPETIEINWSHTYAIDNKQLRITAYADKKVEILAGAPTRELSAAMRRIRKRFSSEQLKQVHLPPPPPEQAEAE
jgi:hypothetical protein